MNTIPMRLFGLAITLISLYGIYYNWQSALNEHRYMVKLAFLAPMGVVAGLFVMILPQLSGKPETRAEIVAASIVGVLGVAAGALNWYLLAYGF